jgi:hypothetical protein
MVVDRDEIPAKESRDDPREPKGTKGKAQLKGDRDKQKGRKDVGWWARDAEATEVTAEPWGPWEPETNTVVTQLPESVSSARTTLEL